MKTAISLPDSLFAAAEAAAKELDVSRSKLIQLALEDFIRRRKDAAITEAINLALERDGGLDAEDERWLEHGRRMVIETLKDDVWE